VRVVVADDVPLFRQGLCSLLEAAGIVVVAQAGDADEAVTQTMHHRPDVTIMDVRMPPTNTDDGLRAGREIKSRLPGMGVLMLSAYGRPPPRGGRPQPSGPRRTRLAERTSGEFRP
jgi:DNA-binding NarL/FixJ family response regulator